MNRKSYLAQQFHTDVEQSRIQSFAFVIGVSVCICLSIAVAASSLSQPHQSREIKLDSRINPNNAPLASLLRLPGVGFGRAEAIVAYRAVFTKQNDNRPAFETADDLQKVKGIGPKTVKNINQWLKFE